MSKGQLYLSFLKMVLSHTSHPKVQIHQHLTCDLQPESDDIKGPMSQTPCPCEAIVTNSSMLDMAGVKTPFQKLSFHVAPGSLPWRTTILMPHNGLFLVINLKTCLVGSRMVASANTG